jgi:hypothetical protein
MTGSLLAHVIVPVVSVLALAAWLAMVFYADAHPRWTKPPRSARAGRGGRSPASVAHRRQ